MDNDTIVGVENTTYLQSEYYFDANVEDDTGKGLAENPYKELNSDRIIDNSVIHLTNGEYVLDKGKSYTNLTIIGENPEKTIIRYDSVGFTSNGLITLKNLTLLKLRVNINSNCNLIAINTIFKESSASNSIIYSTNREYSENTVVLDNCSFYDNSASYGGAINLVGGNLDILNSLFINNHASYYGGAIACDNVTVYMSNSKFINNYAINGAGGAFYLIESPFEATNSEFINCSALFGGAITSLGYDLTLDNITAIDNNAKYYGGAIYKLYTYFDLYGSRFENNSALDGGAVYVDAVELYEINSTYFTNNIAFSVGGAVYSVYSDSYYDIVDKQLKNTFINNTANSYDDVYQSEFINMNIGDNEYILIHYNSSYEGDLPSSYDLRKLGFVTPVKNQANGGNCWAFSAFSALESALLKATGVSYDLSEENMKNLAAMYSDYGWVMETNVGGYDRMAIGYLTSWLGPVNESEDVYNDQSVLSPVLDADIHIQDILFLTRDSYTDNDAIKKAIMEYGAVSTSIYWDNKYLSGKNYYYNGDHSANHAVAIVGWDDSYSLFNFKNVPKGNGAWIVKNSWGPYGGDKGFYYVSYYDTILAELDKYTTYAFVLNDTIKYDKNYQYDIPGRTDYFLNESGTVWYKIKFNASDNEYLAAVSTYFSKDTDWDLSIWVNDVLKLTQSGFSNASYKTIDLDSLIPLKIGDIFEIEFKITVDKEAGVPISEYISLNCEMYGEDISFISYDGENWDDLYYVSWEYPDHTYDSQVACIKAFTILNSINSVIELTCSNIKDNAADIIANVFDEYGNAIKYGVVTFNVDSVYTKVNISNGIAELPNIIIKDGINRFEAEFNAVGYNNSSNYLLVSNTLINTSISLEALSDYNPVMLKATVLDQNDNPVECGAVTFNVDGVDYIVNVMEGVAIFNHTFKTFGLKNISASFNDLYCYNGSNTNISIFMSNILTSITLNIDGQYNPINITAYVMDSNGEKVNQGIVIFNVGGVEHNVDVKEGVASLVDVFSIGSNSVQAKYFDESYLYNSSTCNDSFVVLLKPTTLQLNINQGETVYNPVNITATVVDGDNVLVKTGKAVFSFDDGTIAVQEVVNGKASVSRIFKKMGLNEIFVQFIDVNYYDTSSASVSFNVSRIKVDLSLNIEKDIRDVIIYVEFSEKINENVSVLINDNPYIIRTGGGKAIISMHNLTNGEYSVSANVSSYVYDSNNVTTSFSIKDIPTIIQANDEVFYLNNNMYYSVTIKDKAGIPVSDHVVKLVAGNRTIKAISNSQGKALFKLDLSVGEYNAFIEFDGDKYYLKSNSTKLITVKTTIDLPSNEKYTFNAIYSSKLLDSNGNPLKNQKVKITVNSNEISLSTDSNGNLDYIINLNPGSYTITITNPATGEVKTQNINVVARISENKNLVMYYGAGTYYKVRIYDDYGNVAKGAEVTFTINGRTYSRTTDANGYASIKINLNPNTYTVVVAYKGYKVSNKIVVKPTLILKDVAVKRYKNFKYNVRLLNNKGKILKNKYVTLKFQGKTYKVKTNVKGYAIFKLYSGSKVGKFTLTAAYGSAKISKKITVKK